MPDDGEPAGPLHGAARFRATVRRIIDMRRESAGLGDYRGVGGEPGIDLRRFPGGHRKNCAIDVVDYSAACVKFHKFNNQQFIDFLEANGRRREPWVKVRWISIGGMDWDVIRALAMTYKLHPLSVEDVLQQWDDVRSKVDYFPKYLFLRVLCSNLGDSKDDGINRPRRARVKMLPQHFLPKDFHRQQTTEMSVSVSVAAGVSASMSWAKTETTDEAMQEALETVNKLKADERINVQLRNLFVFLLPNGTLLSIHETPTNRFVRPILDRLGTRDTVLRRTADASLLLHSLLNIAVEQTKLVVDEYQKKTLTIERDILLNPDVRIVRYLHILSDDLRLQKRRVDPLKSLVSELRQHQSNNSDGPNALPHETVGYMSEEAKVYLSDMLDHVGHLVTNLEIFASVSENLIDFTFNMKSYEMNSAMHRMTLAAVIFLPLTLLTGYFGMNFDRMWSVQNNSDALFWKIAAPVMAVVFTLFMWKDIVRAKQFAEKEMEVKRIAAKKKCSARSSSSPSVQSLSDIPDDRSEKV